MPEAIVGTLAVGSQYVELGVRLLRALDAAGNATLVVTDDPAPFPERTIKVPYIPDGAHIWHAKRYVTRAGLDLAQTAYFMDADYTPREGESAPKLAPLPGGLHAVWEGPALGKTCFRNVGYLADVQTRACGPILDLLQAELGAPAWQDLPWWGDNLYAISRSDADSAARLAKFFEAWDRFARFRPTGAYEADARYTLMTGDGVAMTFAAGVAGLRPITNSEALAPLKRAFAHANAGDHHQRALEERRALEEAARCQGS